MKKLFTFTVLLLSIPALSFAGIINHGKIKPDDVKSLYLKVQKFNQFNKLKSTEVIKQQLDSMVEQSDENSATLMYYYTYDSKGHTTSSIIMQSDVDVKTGVERIEYSYDAEGKFKQEKDYRWDDDSNDWVQSVITDITYETGSLIFISSVWDTDSNIWQKLFKTTVIYNSDNNIQSYLMEMWSDDNNSWNAVGDGKYTYNEIGNIVLEESNVFGIKTKTEYTYDVDNNLIAETYYEWDDNTGAWKGNTKTEYLTVTGENKTFEIEYTWSDDLSDWEESIKTERKYDNEGNMFEEVIYGWNWSADEGGWWLWNIKTEFMLDNTYELSDLILPPDNEYYSYQTHKIIEVNKSWYNQSESEWVHSGVMVAYYSERDITSAKNISNEIVRVYPNPASDFVTVNLQQTDNSFRFELFDIQGHKVIDREVVNTQNISLKGLTDGLYFYNLLSGGEKFSGKLLKY